MTETAPTAAQEDERIFDMEDESRLLEALSAKDKSERVFGRMIASGADKALANWVEAEVERGTEPATILLTLISGQMQLGASVAANMLRPTGFDSVKNLYVRMFEKRFNEHARLCFERIEAERAKDPGQAASPS